MNFRLAMLLFFAVRRVGASAPVTRNFQCVDYYGSIENSRTLNFSLKELS